MKRPCPVCKKGIAVKDGNKFWPLCSERCHLVDLGKWLGEEYRVAGEVDPNLAEGAPQTSEDSENS
ncbi:MAG: DNA gyrase inhibitor YacG [Deltaproteobacteria bacterium]|nr:DNA gyrase inhibitor YacG [Deltaproteobacteria bacterium]